MNTADIIQDRSNDAGPADFNELQPPTGQNNLENFLKECGYKEEQKQVFRSIFASGSNTYVAAKLQVGIMDDVLRLKNKLVSILPHVKRKGNNAILQLIEETDELKNKVRISLNRIHQAHEMLHKLQITFRRCNDLGVDASTQTDSTNNITAIQKGGAKAQTATQPNVECMPHEEFTFVFEACKPLTNDELMSTLKELGPSANAMDGMD